MDRELELMGRELEHSPLKSMFEIADNSGYCYGVASETLTAASGPLVPSSRPRSPPPRNVVDTQKRK